MDTDIHAMLQDAEDYLNGELLRITEEWPSEREHQGESMLMPYLSYSKRAQILLSDSSCKPEYAAGSENIQASVGKTGSP